MKVLVTCPPMLKQIDLFRDFFEERGVELITPNVVQVLSEEELLKILPSMDGWIIGDDPATERVFTAGAAGNLKAAVKWGVGVDNVDFTACKKLGIPISNTPNMFGGEVADLALCFLIGLARSAFLIDRKVREEDWIKPTGVSVSEKTVAVIGLGDIGCSTIQRLKGFGVDIIGYDPFSEISSEELGISSIALFPNDLEKADFIILTCALTESSKHIISESSINRMKNGVCIINVARGGLIDEGALLKALESGKVKSAALDVFETEPLSPDNPLRSFDNCIFGTHNGSNTHEAVVRASHKAISLLFNYLNLPPFE